ncbi:hypothetical protein NMG60_11018708 [Bertholletia excelsa]
MFADLESLPNLPPVRLPSAGVQVPAEGVPPIPNATSNRDCAEECHTPTAPENRIPPALTCPPAPKRKRRWAASPRKRCELVDFYKIVIIDKEELESVMRSAFGPVLPKRRRPST